jgi:MFS family permease
VVSSNSAGSLAQPAIADAFGAGPADVGWVVFGFSAAFAVATAVWGGIARQAGLGRALAAGILLYSAAGLVAALAPNLGVLIAARIVQGLGAGAVPSLSATAVAGRFEGAARARALGSVVAGVGIGLAVGPILGGVALQLVGWQGAIAFGIVAAPAAFLIVREDQGRATGGRLDLRGIGLVATAALGAVFLLNRLPVQGLGPVTLIAVGLMVASSVLIVRRWDRPGAFLPRRIALAPAFTRVVLLGAVGMSAFFGSLVLVPVAVSRAHGLDGIALGLVLVPMAIISAISSLQNSRVNVRLGRSRTTLVSLGSLAAGSIALATIGPDVDPAITALALAPLGVGFGLLGPPLLDELTTAIPAEDRAVAVGSYHLVYFLGGTAGASLSTALVQVGAELPFLAGRSVPGFSTAELLVAIPPVAAIVILLLRGRRAGAAAARGTAA